MGHFTDDSVTASPAKAIHAGVNFVTASYTLGETASGSTTIAIIPLPGGARVADVTCWFNHATIGTGAEQVAVKDHLGNTYIRTTSAANSPQRFDPVFADIGARLTSSSHLVVSLHECVGTGTASTVCTVTCSYISEDDPD
jgi:hypothetical protein